MIQQHQQQQQQMALLQQQQHQQQQMMMMNGGHGGGGGAGGYPQMGYGYGRPPMGSYPMQTAYAMPPQPPAGEPYNYFSDEDPNSCSVM